MKYINKIVIAFLFFATIQISATSQSITVKGKAIHGTTKKPIRGIYIKYKEFAAAISDSNGLFAINVPSAGVLLTAEGDGFQTKEFAVKGNTIQTIMLFETGFNSFSDEAVTAYKSFTKTISPNAVSTVQVNDGWTRSSENPDGYLQGNVAGLLVKRRNGNGNSGANLLLRGIHSLYATNQPLIFVDGVIFNNSNLGGSIIAGQYFNPLSGIDVRDIDNVTVVKDASSLYGTKGANGAIYITTIRAKELGTKIDFAVYTGFNKVPESLPVLKASDYRVYLSEMLKSKGMTDAQIQMQPYMNDDVTNPLYYAYHNETDWQSKVLQNSVNNNVYLKVAGGDNIAKYAISLGYVKSGSIIDKNDLNKYNMRFNGDLNISRRLTAVTNLSFNFAEQNIRDQGNASTTNPLFMALVKSPFMRTNEVSALGIESPSLADRDTLNIGNPLSIINAGQGLNKTYRFLGSIGFNFAINNKLKLSNILGITYNKLRENYFVPKKGVVPDTLSTSIANNRLGSQTSSMFSFFNDLSLNYATTMRKVHSLNTKVGVRIMNDKMEQDFGLGYNSAIDELISVGNGLNNLRRIGGELGQSKWFSSYAGVDYSFKDKYLLSGNVAMDASSKFGNNIASGLNISGNSFAVLPSIAAAWLISSEKLFANSNINLLKLRASYGLSGNDDIGNFTARQTYVTQNLLGLQGLVRSGMANDQLQWEKVIKTNVGLDLAIFNERLQLSFDVYNHKTNNLIVYEKLPTFSGFDYAITNSGALTTKGMEISIGSRIINTKNWTWDLNTQIAKSTSTINKLPNSTPIVTTFSGATFITNIGGAPNAFYGHITQGVYTTDADAASNGLSIRKADGSLVPFKGGDMKFVDLNNDKIIDENDRTVIGNSNPDLFGSVSNTLRFKRFQLSALGVFSIGNEIYNHTRAQLESMTNVNNQTIAVLNRWRNNGHFTNIPKATWGDPMGNARFSDRWMEDGSYFRLSNVSLSYDLKLNSKFFKNATVYTSANNILTLTKYKGYDPEFSATESIFGQGVDNGLVPIFKSIQLGFRIGL